MWYLKHLTKCISEEDYYYILGGSLYVVGRKDCQILIDDDPSISRKHCVLRVVHSAENIAHPEKPAVLKIKDSSKYGTSRNSVRLEKDVEVDLNDGDILKFGQFQSDFKVCYKPLIITTSCLNDAKKVAVKKAVQMLCGHLVSDWRESCTHLVMSDIKVTVKALCCLVSLKPIISPEYITDFLVSVKNRTAIPSLDSYLPAPDEPLIDQERASFQIVADRKTLFSSMVFVFLDNNQLFKLKLIITSGGGSCILLTENTLNDPILFGEKRSCVIQPPNITKLAGDTFSIFVKKVMAILKRKKKRMVQEQEIGLAVVYCSTEEYCNPDSEANFTPRKQPPVLSQSCLQEVYAYDTQSMSLRSKQICGTAEESFKHTLESRVIPDHSSSLKQTATDRRDSNGKKRLHSLESTVKDDVDDNQQSNKRIKLETNIETSENALATEESVPLFQAHSSSNSSSSNNSGSSSKKICLSRVGAVDDIETNINGSNSGKKNQSEKAAHGRSSVPSVSPSVQPDGFRCIPKRKENVSDENQSNRTEREEIPRNLMKITLVELVTNEKPFIKKTENNSSVKNFKKFRKTGYKSLVREITDFVEYNCQKLINNMANDKKQSHSSHETQEDRGDFDWNSLK